MFVFQLNISAPFLHEGGENEPQSKRNIPKAKDRSEGFPAERKMERLSAFFESIPPLLLRQHRTHLDSQPKRLTCCRIQEMARAG